MTEALPKKQSNFVRDALASNPTLLSVYDGLEASGECRLKFCSTRNMKYRGMLQASISEQWGTRADSGEVARLGLLISCIPACDSLGSNVELRTLDALRGKMWLRKKAPNSISRLVPFMAGAGAEGEAYTFGAAVVTLALQLDGQEPPTTASDVRRRSPTVEPLGPRPDLEPLWLDRPDRVAIADLVSQFLNDPLGLQKACLDQAKSLGLLAYRDHQADRLLAKFQLEALLPVKKAFIGFGIGETTLKIATLNMMEQAKAATTRDDAISRDELIHLFWAHALETGGRKPPLVML